jgi:predicted double-glycine peptidase
VTEIHIPAMSRRRKLWRGLARARLLWSVVFSVLCLTPAMAGDVTLSTPNADIYSLHIVSYSEIPFETVIRQQFDYSCGSAALATLLRFGYSRNIDEAGVFKAMYAVGDQQKIQRLGFSLLDMKKYLASEGYQADGFRVDLGQLEKLNTPAIALIKIGPYRHFVVIKGVAGSHVLVGDPAQGLHVYSSDDFVKLWNGIAFMIRPGPKADGVFNSAVEWSRWSDAHPLSAAVLNRSITPFTRDLRVQYQIEPNQILPSPF